MLIFLRRLFKLTVAVQLAVLSAAALAAVMHAFLPFTVGVIEE